MGGQKKSRLELFSVAATSSSVSKDQYFPFYHYDLDSDDEEPTLPRLLHWRNPLSLSDWTIEVVIAPPRSSSATDVLRNKKGVSENAPQTYQVHKSVIALESQYYQDLFAPKQTTSIIRNSSSSPSAMTVAKSRFHLPVKALQCFPELLDYMYAPNPFHPAGDKTNDNNNNKCTISFLTTNNAAVFHSPGQLLGMPRLCFFCKQFWVRDIEKKTNLDATLALYYEHAIQFDNAKLMDAVLTTCSDPLVFWSLTAESAIFRIPDPRLCLHLVQQVGGRGDASIRSSTNNSDRLSQLVASFCSQHFVNPATFARLTDPLTMPTITTVSSQVALSLLKLECAILGGPEPVTSNGLTSLQERCLVALEKTWHELDVDCLSNGFLQSVAKQSPEFLIVLLSRTLGAAQREFSNSGSGTSSKVDDVAANGDHDNADFFDAIGEPATPYDQDQIDAPPISGNDFHPISGNDFHIHDEGTPNEMVNSDDDRGPNDNGSIIDSNLESIGQ